MVKLPTDKQQRKETPIATGVLGYFPDAIAAIARVSYAGNQQHNPGQPLHWAREKSTDHADCIIRHFMERGTIDEDGMRHSAKMAWRALALLQLELEAAELKDSVPDGTGNSHELDERPFEPGRNCNPFKDVIIRPTEPQLDSNLSPRTDPLVSEKGDFEDPNNPNHFPAYLRHTNWSR